jgi:hypothetical protein
MSSILKNRLDRAYECYAQSSFIDNDPIAIPHSFSQIQDIEIAGFFAAIFSWGRRDIILPKSKELMDIMNHQPFEFVANYSSKDRKKINVAKLALSNLG